MRTSFNTKNILQSEHLHVRLFQAAIMPTVNCSFAYRIYPMKMSLAVTQILKLCLR